MEIGAYRGAAKSVDQYLLYLYGGKWLLALPVSSGGLGIGEWWMLIWAMS